MLQLQPILNGLRKCLLNDLFVISSERIKATIEEGTKRDWFLHGAASGEGADSIQGSYSCMLRRIENESDIQA